MSLLQKGYTPGSVNAFLSAANSYLDYIGHREFQLAGYMKEWEMPNPGTALCGIFASAANSEGITEEKGISLD